jgi:hypothetical protein
MMARAARTLSLAADHQVAVRQYLFSYFFIFLVGLGRIYPDKRVSAFPGAQVCDLSRHLCRLQIPVS